MREPVPYFLRRSTPVTEGESLPLHEAFVDDSEIQLQDYWRVIRKRGWMIAAFFVGVVLVAGVGLLLTTPAYTAKATLLIERHTPQVLDMKELLTESLIGTDEYDYYKTQFEVLKSRSLAAQVIKGQGLEQVLASEEEKSLSERFVGPVVAWIKHFLPKDTRISVGNPLGVDPELMDTYVNEKLEIAPIARTRLVEVGYSSHDPELSARVANAHAHAYIHQGLGFRNKASEEAQGFLKENLVELKERVEKSEAALNRYRREKKIVSLDDKENTVVERLSDLNKHLTDAEVDRITLGAQMRLVKQGKFDSLPSVVDNQLIHNLKKQLTRLEGDYARLSEEFTEDYPPVGQLKAQIEETRRRLQQEIQTIVRGTESAYQAAQAREKELRTKMEEQRTTALALKDAAVEYGILAREADSNLQLYNSVLQRMKEMGVAAELRASNVFVVDDAEAPLKPSKPKTLFTLLLSMIAGIGGGVGLAFFCEYLDNTLKTSQEVERFLHLPHLGAVPDFAAVEGRTYAGRELVDASRRFPVLPTANRKELVLSHHPHSVVTEAYRELRTAILLSRAEEPPRTILFTSGVSGEGKTTTVLNTAILFAQMGVRILVVDADLRRSGCHEALGVRNGLGLTEVLTGQREAFEVIKPLDAQNLFFLSSGSTSPNPTELVGSKKMYETLNGLREQYDYVLIDAPPVRAVSDAVLLSTMVDGVVLVVNAQKTPKPIAKEAHSRLSYARASMLGAVLNRVKVQKEDYAIY